MYFTSKTWCYFEKSMWSLSVMLRAMMLLVTMTESDLKCDVNESNFQNLQAGKVHYIRSPQMLMLCKLNAQRFDQSSVEITQHSKALQAEFFETRTLLKIHSCIIMINVSISLTAQARWLYLSMSTIAMSKNVPWAYSEMLYTNVKSGTECATGLCDGTIMGCVQGTINHLTACHKSSLLVFLVYIVGFLSMRWFTMQGRIHLMLLHILYGSTTL